MTISVTDTSLESLRFVSNYDMNDPFLEQLLLEREEKKRRKKMKSDPNQLRMKSKNKSTRPKWMDRV